MEHQLHFANGKVTSLPGWMFFTYENELSGGPNFLGAMKIVAHKYKLLA
jgi:hypothetical protein